MAVDLPLDLQVAIVAPSGIPAGSGLILDAHHILTCAHVIRAVTGGKPTDPPPWDSDINICLLPCRWHCHIGQVEAVFDRGEVRLRHWNRVAELSPG
jgi:hypothetical protein